MYFLILTVNQHTVRKDNNGVSLDAFLYATYRFINNWRASESINCNSPSVLLQGMQAGFISHNLAATKQFLKDKKGSVGLTINNAFQQKRTYYRKLSDPSFIQVQQSGFIIRFFTITFNYRFDELKEDISRKKRGIKNDDLKTTD